MLQPSADRDFRPGLKWVFCHAATYAACLAVGEWEYACVYVWGLGLWPAIIGYRLKMRGRIEQNRKEQNNSLCWHKRGGFLTAYNWSVTPRRLVEMMKTPEATAREMGMKPSFGFFIYSRSSSPSGPMAAYTRSFILHFIPTHPPPPPPTVSLRFCGGYNPQI